MPSTSRAAFIARLTDNREALGLKTIAPYKGQFRDAASKAVDLGTASPAAFVLAVGSDIRRLGSRNRLSALLFVRDRTLERDDDQAAALAEGLAAWLLANPAWSHGGREYCVFEPDGVAVELFAQASAYAIWAVSATVDQM